MGRQKVGGWITAALMAIAGAFPAARADVFEKHAVVAQEGHAAEIGRDVLRRGGNAIDAAVATAFALAVTLPEAGNLGGGGFIVAYLADAKKVVTIDFREIAPLASTPTMYLGADGKPRPHHREGAWAGGVPGTVRGLGLAHKQFGKLPWEALVTPAARLARDGFPISADLAGSLNRQLGKGGRANAARGDRLGDFPESVAVFARPDGAPWKAGDRLVEHDLSTTLDRIARNGPDEFYTGETARLFAKYMSTHGGLITLEDLARYQAKPREPIHTTFKGFDIYGMAPVSSGGVVIATVLNILEPFDLKTDGRENPLTLHRITEAMRRAYFIRATRLGDPDFVPVPVAELVSKPFAARLAQSIGDRATRSADLAPFVIQPVESDHTTHFSTIDSAGNAVALTYTLEDSYGAKCVIEGCGFLLNNEMGDFNLIPGRTDVSGRIGTEPNQIAPGKRMLSSQSPTLVIKDGKVHVVTGSPGGRKIPNTTLWVLLNVLEFGMDPASAVAAPRTHHQWFPDRLSLEGGAWPKSTRDALTERGHHLSTLEHQGNANSIVVDRATGKIHGVPDPRRSTTRAAGD